MSASYGVLAHALCICYIKLLSAFIAKIAPLIHPGKTPAYPANRIRDKRSLQTKCPTSNQAIAPMPHQRIVFKNKKR
ncbi:hypothetical protein DWV97_00060 [Ruminococcus sp. AF14-10]|nr:hypothetical protein DWV97_00060 [Ruminococcus sp. AF14-10]